jgi:hypothetical protein
LDLFRPTGRRSSVLAAHSPESWQARGQANTWPLCVLHLGDGVVPAGELAEDFKLADVIGLVPGKKDDAVENSLTPLGIVERVEQRGGDLEGFEEALLRR